MALFRPNGEHTPFWLGESCVTSRIEVTHSTESPSATGNVANRIDLFRPIEATNSVADGESSVKCYCSLSLAHSDGVQCSSGMATSI